MHIEHPGISYRFKLNVFPVRSRIQGPNGVETQGNSQLARDDRRSTRLIWGSGQVCGSAWFCAAAEAWWTRKCNLTASIDDSELIEIRERLLKDARCRASEGRTKQGTTVASATLRHLVLATAHLVVLGLGFSCSRPVMNILEATQKCLQEWESSGSSEWCVGARPAHGSDYIDIVAAVTNSSPALILTRTIPNATLRSPPSIMLCFPPLFFRGRPKRRFLSTP